MESLDALASRVRTADVVDAMGRLHRHREDSVMDAYNPHHRARTVRVAACTLRTTPGDPAANAHAVHDIARECHHERAAVAVFPELALTGYSIDDILMQDALPDAVEDELQSIAQASVELMPVLVIGAPLRHLHRIYNTAVVIHRGRVLGVAPKSYLPTYREFYELRQMAAGDDICDEISWRRYCPDQSVGKPRHHRSSRRPMPADSISVAALHRRIYLRGSGGGRIYN